MNIFGFDIGNFLSVITTYLPEEESAASQNTKVLLFPVWAVRSRYRKLFDFAIKHKATGIPQFENPFHNWVWKNAPGLVARDGEDKIECSEPITKEQAISSVIKIVPRQINK